MPRLSLILVAWVLMHAGVAAAQRQARQTVLLDFSGLNGITPLAGVVFGADGNLYGTAAGGGTSSLGTVFKLTPPVPPATRWTDTTIHSFIGGISDGAGPSTSLTLDAAGNIFGTTAAGGNSNGGTVFVLSPPAAGHAEWTSKVLSPYPISVGGAVLLDASNDVFATSANGGSFNAGYVFELTPRPHGVTPWHSTLLYQFGSVGDGASPSSFLIRDASGNLYGETSYTTANAGAGTVYKLSPPATASSPWTETLLNNFPSVGSAGAEPTGGLAFDSAGNLYGTTRYGGAYGKGVVFKLTPLAGGGAPWTETVLHAFSGIGNDGANPVGGVVLDSTGNVYGATPLGGSLGAGTVFRLTPQAAGAWTAATIYNFSKPLGIGGVTPAGSLAIDAAGHLFGAAEFGGTGACTFQGMVNGCGTIYQIAH